MHLPMKGSTVLLPVRMEWKIPFPLQAQSCSMRSVRNLLISKSWEGFAEPGEKGDSETTIATCYDDEQT